MKNIIYLFLITLIGSTMGEHIHLNSNDLNSKNPDSIEELPPRQKRQINTCNNCTVNQQRVSEKDYNNNCANTLTAQFPGSSGLGALIGQKVRIKSPYFNEYLYTDITAVTQGHRWSVFFDRSKRSNGRKFHWTIVKVDSYKEGYALKNEWNTWLYSPISSFLADSERRMVFVWIPLDDFDYTGEWVIEPVPNSSTNFYIRSKHRDEYLYPLNDGAQPANKGRPVYTWVPKLTDFDLQMEWVFEPVS